MKYGLIGEKLGHSFSKEIHEALGYYKYDINEVTRESFDEFMQKKDFTAINVTIPYKEMVIPYLYDIDSKAKSIGAVNTIVNKKGKLYGYNTDYYGLKSLIERLELNVKDKRALILGTGGTSKTCTVVLKDLGIKEIIYVSINNEPNTISYEDAVEQFNDVDFIFNTTPCGMYPNNDDLIISLEKFNKLEGVVDVIYNPLNTRIVIEAKKKQIKSINGLYMLVSQAVHASSIFLGIPYDDNKTISIYDNIVREKENIVLIGMPSCGKSTIGKRVSEYLNKDFVDTDKIITERISMPIKDFIEQYGEEEFRKVEIDVIKDLSKNNNLVISTGGGVIKKSINMDRLKANGKIIFIDRDLELLKPTESRPLSNNWEDMKKLYKERYPIYLHYADYVQKNNGEPFELAADELIEYLK